VGWSCASNVNQLLKLRGKQVKTLDPTQLYTARFVVKLLNVSFWLLKLSLEGLQRNERWFAYKL
jgi:hypothetical protein